MSAEAHILLISPWLWRRSWHRRCRSGQSLGRLGLAPRHQSSWSPKAADGDRTALDRGIAWAADTGAGASTIDNLWATATEIRAEPPSPTLPERRLTLRQADHVGDYAIKHDELHSVTLDLHSSVAIAELSLLVFVLS